MMEYWMGRASRIEAARKLGIPPLRVWQLSQQAVSGMVVGLLKQPKSRKNPEESMNPADNPKELRKKIAELEKTIAMQDRMIAVLREMPGCRDVRLDTQQYSPKIQGGQASAESKSSSRQTKTPIPKGARRENREVAERGSSGDTSS
jgi:hypothetical protein